MNKNLVAVLGLATALAAAPAFAQTANSGAQHNGAANSNANTTGWITKPAQNQWLASHLKGVDVYNAQNQKISSIDELIMDQNGNVQAVVLDVGGFLGMGVHRVAVPYRELRFSEQPVNQSNNTASNNNNRAPANAPAMNTTSNNAPGNPTANTAANTGLGGATNTGANVNRTDNNGATVGSTVSSTNNGARRNENWPDHAVLNMTQDQLKNAPEFRYNS